MHAGIANCWSRWRGNVPGIPGACATRNFTYLVRGPWRSNQPCHQQPWRWPGNLGWILYFKRIYYSHIQHVNVEEWWEMRKGIDGIMCYAVLIYVAHWGLIKRLLFSRHERTFSILTQISPKLFPKQPIRTIEILLTSDGHLWSHRIGLQDGYKWAWKTL